LRQLARTQFQGLATRGTPAGVEKTDRECRARWDMAMEDLRQRCFWVAGQSSGGWTSPTGVVSGNAPRAYVPKRGHPSANPPVCSQMSVVAISYSIHAEVLWYIPGYVPSTHSTRNMRGFLGRKEDRKDVGRQAVDAGPAARLATPRSAMAWHSRHLPATPSFTKRLWSTPHFPSAFRCHLPTCQFPRCRLSRTSCARPDRTRVPIPTPQPPNANARWPTNTRSSSCFQRCYNSGTFPTRHVPGLHSTVTCYHFIFGNAGACQWLDETRTQRSSERGFE